MWAKTKKEELDMLRNEYDPRSPKLRVMILSYLTGSEAKPTVEQLNETLAWVTADRDGFLEAVEASIPEDEPEAEDTKSNAEEDVFKGSYI